MKRLPYSPFPSIATLLCVVGLLFGNPARAQIHAQIVLPRPKEAVPIYTAIGASDDHNCTVIGSFLGPYASPWAERTTDGGLTWTRQNLSLPDSEHSGGSYIYSVYAIDSLNVLLLGDSGLILRTTNAGSSWADESFPGARGRIEASFLDSANGIITGGGGLLLRTTNAGASWEQLPALPYAALYSPQMLSPDSIVTFRYGVGPVFTITQNGSFVDSTGLIFDSERSIYGDSGISEIFWIRNSGSGVGFGDFHGFDGTRKSLIKITTNAGKSWSIVLLRTTIADRSDLTGGSSALLNGGVVFTGNFGGIVWTNNVWANTPWTEDSVTAPVNFSEISNIVLLDSNHALAILDDGARLHTPLNAWIARITLNSNAGVSNLQVITSSLQLYPNPASETVTITSSNHGKEVELMDILGRVLLHGIISGTGVLTMNITSLLPGYYYITDGLSRAKFVKE